MFLEYQVVSAEYRVTALLNGESERRVTAETQRRGGILFGVLIIDFLCVSVPL
jgi:hypothetical protein